MHYLVTGHTGFKGSWLSLMLQMQGHTVSGISLNPPEKSLFNDANLSELFKNDLRIDIRNSTELSKAVKEIDPQVIIHLAAQPLVRESYKDPVGTFETNVLGTLNLLEATRALAGLSATLVITTDKVYKNHNQLRGYVETDELGGDDPYSASKAAADIATQSWAKSYATTPVAIARAGNVIGGGDWADDRLVPDLVRAYMQSQIPLIRYPNAIRPWQHVLDCLNGYLCLIDAMLKEGVTGVWNFGPEKDQMRSVEEVVQQFTSSLNQNHNLWRKSSDGGLHESSLLVLNSTKSHNRLNWKNKLSWDESIEITREFYFENKINCLEMMKQQIVFFDKKVV